MSEDEPFLRAGDEAMARRLKALACTASLHQLDSRKTRLDWLEGTDYQMAEIALQAIDQVTIAMDFDRGAAPEQVVRSFKRFIIVSSQLSPAWSESLLEVLKNRTDPMNRSSRSAWSAQVASPSSDTWLIN